MHKANFVPLLSRKTIRKRKKYKKKEKIRQRSSESVGIVDVRSELRRRKLLQNGHFLWNSNIIDMELTGIREIAAHQNEVGKTQIEERIFNIRGRQVMIDRDLALLYQVSFDLPIHLGNFHLI